MNNLFKSWIKHFEAKGTTVNQKQTRRLLTETEGAKRPWQKPANSMRDYSSLSYIRISDVLEIPRLSLRQILK